LTHTLSPSHQDNLVRWNPTQANGSYESHFIKVNMPDQDVAFWWKFTILQPVSSRGPTQFEVWAIVFDSNDPSQSFAVKECFETAQSTVDRDRLHCRYGDNMLEHGHTQGAIRGVQTIEWDIHWDPPENGFRHFPKAWMYKGRIPKAKALSPVPSASFRGSVQVGEKTYVLDGHPGMQGHNWGVQHAEQWVWVHSNQFLQEQTAFFEAVSSKIKLGPLRSPQLTILHLEDGIHDPLTINSWSGMLGTQSTLEGLQWSFRGTQGKRAIEGSFMAPPERFVAINYTDPDGRTTHCLNSKIAQGEIRVLHRSGAGWRLKRTLTTASSAALEIGLKDELRGVKLHLS
jgi:hypothetical protein